MALDLGLRTAEINRLRLDDIDWRHGTVTLKRTKSKRQDVLPLPVATGKALEDYIRHERPASRNQAVFVRHLAPYDQAVGTAAIRSVVRRAFRRATCVSLWKCCSTAMTSRRPRKFWRTTTTAWEREM